MSRIGKQPVSIPSGVTAEIEGQTVSAKGPKGELSFVLNDLVVAEMTEDGDQGRSDQRIQDGARDVGHVAHTSRQYREWCDVGF